MHASDFFSYTFIPFVSKVAFSHLGFWSGNLFVIAPFPILCLLVHFFSCKIVVLLLFVVKQDALVIQDFYSFPPYKKF